MIVYVACREEHPEPVTWRMDMTEQIEWAVQYLYLNTGTLRRIYFGADEARAREVARVLAPEDAELLEIRVRLARPANHEASA
jgi:hypothetical protein